MLRNKEKNSIFRGIFLIVGWGLGLNRFYEGTKRWFFYQALVGSSLFLALSFWNVQILNMMRVWKNYSVYSPNPLIILPLLAGAFGGFKNN